MLTHTTHGPTPCSVGIIVAIFSFLSLYDVSHGQTCTKVDDCACKFSDGTKIDISSLGEVSGGPRFNYAKPAGDTSSIWEFAFNPCYDFSDNFCSDVVSCQRATDLTSSFPLGTASSASWSSDGKTVRYQSVGSDGITRTSVLNLICDPSGNPNNPTLVTNGEDTSITGQYNYQLTSKCACPDGCKSGGTGGGLSVGSVLCILFVIVVLVYLVGGMVYMKAVKGAEGKEIIPNIDFWMDFHNYVKDGCLFITSKCYGADSSEYEHM